MTRLSPAPAWPYNAPGRLVWRRRQPQGPGLSPSKQQEPAQHLKQGKDFCSDLIISGNTTNPTQTSPLFQLAAAAFSLFQAVMRDCQPGWEQESGELFSLSLVPNAQKLRVHCFNCWTQRLNNTPDRGLGDLINMGSQPQFQAGEKQYSSCSGTCCSKSDHAYKWTPNFHWIF